MVRSGYSNQLKRELIGGDVASAQGMTEIHKHSSCIGFAFLICSSACDLCSCFGPTKCVSFILHCFSFEEVFALFGTSWPMLLTVTFISLHKSTFCSSFPA